VTLEPLGPVRLRALFDKHDIHPRKQLGQNFVIDPNTIDKIVAIAEVAPSDHVLEIGAGAGSLTIGLVAVASRVVAVEFDRRLIPVLREALAGAGNVDIVEEDVLDLDLGVIRADRLVSNLPYNIAATVVLRVLSEAEQIRDLTVMTQKEVGERLAAHAGSKAYGQTSVMVAYYGRARVAGRVSRRAFWPVPAVDSVIVIIDRGDPPDADRDTFFSVVRAAFSQRRKTLRNCLAPLAGSAEAAEDALRASGLDPGVRAEQVDLDGFVALTRILSRTSAT
jgi:16S rRNA (adenine1518-N6/adenine1519-N6)-dimethyltransferase